MSHLQLTSKLFMCGALLSPWQYSGKDYTDARPYHISEAMSLKVPSFLIRFRSWQIPKITTRFSTKCSKSVGTTARLQSTCSFIPEELKRRLLIGFSENSAKPLIWGIWWRHLVTWKITATQVDESTRSGVKYSWMRVDLQSTATKSYRKTDDKQKKTDSILAA